MTRENLVGIVAESGSVKLKGTGGEFACRIVLQLMLAALVDACKE